MEGTSVWQPMGNRPGNQKAELAGEIFGHVAAGRIKIEINQRYALEDAEQAHRDLESRKTTGSSIFVI